MKNTIQWTILIILIIAACIATYTAYNKTTEIMEQQQSKIEQEQNKNKVLQEENAYLHDVVANLSNDLMKMNK